MTEEPTVDQEIVRWEQRNWELKRKLKAYNEIFIRVIDKARDIRHQTDSDSQLASLMRGLVELQDNREMDSALSKDINNNIKAGTQELGQRVFQFSIDDLTRELGLDGLL